MRFESEEYFYLADLLAGGGGAGDWRGWKSAISGVVP